MRTDSNIVEHVLKRFIALETPVLPVHDSFIVQASTRSILEDAMREASKAVTGVELPFEQAPKETGWRSRHQKQCVAYDPESCMELV